MSRKLGDLVKKARTEKGLTQAGLAEKVDGLTASDVSKIERGEKEPVQDILKQMAKALGVTQKSLLDAATGSGKTTSSSKTGTAAKKTSSAKKTSAIKDTIDTLKLTATEKKLVQLYRKADTKTKKAAINLLEGDSNAIELIGALLSAKGSGSSGSSGSSGTSDLLSALLSGKTGGSSSGAAGKDTMNALMELLGKAGK
ncbi:MAG: helix-turn-helix domain-containing protein [Lachnospiraceae bacterium]|nr:helix-turn-helix domain-containing protein [Lachnospiraceae bacterium]MBQ8328308.1 helix-turn-helix domain-containing protein [Lachnospiraceae bacterium]